MHRPCGPVCFRNSASTPAGLDSIGGKPRARSRHPKVRTVFKAGSGPAPDLLSVADGRSPDLQRLRALTTSNRRRAPPGLPSVCSVYAPSSRSLARAVHAQRCEQVALASSASPLGPSARSPSSACKRDSPLADPWDVCACGAWSLSAAVSRSNVHHGQARA